MTTINTLLYRVRNCDTNMTSNTPANQYQRQKIIQNTVRVPSSLYTMNLGSLNAYARPTLPSKVCWNQMSDRPEPSLQKTYVPTRGSQVGSSSTKHTVTGPRPGAQSPGGLGCDIKHNSYDRYLNRIKGKAPLRRGVVPPTFGSYIPFNRALPVYGGKTVKTSIVSNCNCPISSNDDILFDNPLYQPIVEPSCIFGVGEYVYARKDNSHYYVRAYILNEIAEQVFLIRFDDDTQAERPCDQLKIYFSCDCPDTPDPNELYNVLVADNLFGISCVDPTYLNLKNGNYNRNVRPATENIVI
jgi:hypothetical protein